MFGFITKTLETVTDVALLPVAVVADTVTLGGALNDRKEPYTVSKSKRITKNLVDAVDKLAS